MCFSAFQLWLSVPGNTKKLGGNVTVHLPNMKKQLIIASIDIATSSKNKIKYSLTCRISAPVSWTHHTCRKWSSVCTSPFSLCWVTQCISLWLRLFKMKQNKINPEGAAALQNQQCCETPDESSAHHRNTKINPRISADMTQAADQDTSCRSPRLDGSKQVWLVIKLVTLSFVHVDRPVGSTCDQMNGL